MKCAVVLSLLFSAAAFGLVSPCSVPLVGTSEAWAKPDDVLVFAGDKPIGMCSYGFKTSTPSLIAVEGVQYTETGFRIFVRALAPGDGVLRVYGGLPGGSSYDRVTTVIHIDSCAAGAHTIDMLPAYSAPSKSLVKITPQFSGTFTGSFTWLVNGSFQLLGPVFLFTAPSDGVYSVTVKGESRCGAVEKTTTLYVGAQRFRSVRRR